MKLYKALSGMFFLFFGSFSMADAIEELKKPTAFNYTYIESNYVARDSYGDGFSVSGSYAIFPNLSVHGGYITTSKEKSISRTFSKTNEKKDFSHIYAGVMYQQKIENIQGMDYFVYLDLERVERKKIESFYSPLIGGTISRSLENNNDFGARLGAGVRYEAIKNLEVFGDASLATTSDMVYRVTGGARYTLFGGLSAQAFFQFSEEFNWGVGGRYTF